MQSQSSGQAEGSVWHTVFRQTKSLWWELMSQDPGCGSRGPFPLLARTANTKQPVRGAADRPKSPAEGSTKPPNHTERRHQGEPAPGIQGERPPPSLKKSTHEPKATTFGLSEQQPRRLELQAPSGFGMGAEMVMWDEAKVPTRPRLQQCLVDYPQSSLQVWFFPTTPPFLPSLHPFLCLCHRFPSRTEHRPQAPSSPSPGPGELKILNPDLRATMFLHFSPLLPRHHHTLISLGVRELQPPLSITFPSLLSRLRARFYNRAAQRGCKQLHQAPPLIPQTWKINKKKTLLQPAARISLLWT